MPCALVAHFALCNLVLGRPGQPPDAVRSHVVPCDHWLTHVLKPQQGHQLDPPEDTHGDNGIS